MVQGPQLAQNYGVDCSRTKGAGPEHPWRSGRGVLCGIQMSVLCHIRVDLCGEVTKERGTSEPLR